MLLICKDYISKYENRVFWSAQRNTANKKQVLIILINLLTATQEVHVSNSVRYGNTSELLALSKMGCVITQPIFDNASNSEDEDQRLADGRTSDDGLYRDMHSVAR